MCLFYRCGNLRTDVEKLNARSKTINLQWEPPNPALSSSTVLSSLCTLTLQKYDRWKFMLILQTYQFYSLKHNAHSGEGPPLDRSKWNWLLKDNSLSTPSKTGRSLVWHAWWGARSHFCLALHSSSWLTKCTHGSCLLKRWIILQVKHYNCSTRSHFNLTSPRGSLLLGTLLQQCFFVFF